MRRRDLILAGCASLLPHAWAHAGPRAQSRWIFDKPGSTIELNLSALGQTRRGRFSDWAGSITFDPSAPSRTRASVTLQAASLRLTPSMGTERAIGPDFLDAARYPTIRFELTSVEPAGGDRYTARADVTMKGRTRPVTFPVDLSAAPSTARLTGAFTINRADFGIGSGPWNRMVGRQATVRFNLLARPA